MSSAGKEISSQEQGQGQGHQKSPSPSPRAMRRSWSVSSSSACGQGTPKCVCAPATHAGSFKCRLHRVNPNGHLPTSPRQPAVSSASATARTVEAK